MNADQKQDRSRWLPVAGLCLLCAILGAAVALAVTAAWLGRTLERAATEVAKPPAGEGSKQAVGEESKPAAGGESQPTVDKDSRPTATAYLRVAAREPALVFGAAESAVGNEFEIYKATQQQLLESRFVLAAALRKPEVAKLRCVQRKEDPIDWLAGELRATFPGDAEIMQVSLAGEDPEEAAVLVNAVVDAYLAEVVERDRSQRRQRLDQLDRAYAEKEAEVREKRSNLKRLAEQLGTEDSIDLTMMRSEIEQLEEVLKTIGVEREKLKIELRAPPRITLIQPAEVP